MPKDGQGALTEQAIGAEQPDAQRKAHRQSESDEQDVWMERPRQFKNIS